VGQLQTSSGWDEVRLKRYEKTEDTMIHYELEDESCDDHDSDIHCLAIKSTSLLHRFRRQTGEDYAWCCILNCLFLSFIITEWFSRVWDGNRLRKDSEEGI
jgi:hypothetical protein